MGVTDIKKSWGDLKILIGTGTLGLLRDQSTYGPSVTVGHEYEKGWF